MTPERVQLSRQRGWRMPPNTVKVDRTTKFGNPFSGGSLTNADCVKLFRGYAKETIANNPSAFDELRGKNLACWCKPGEPCHADVLIEIANADTVKNLEHQS